MASNPFNRNANKSTRPVPNPWSPPHNRPKSYPRPKLPRVRPLSPWKPSGIPGFTPGGLKPPKPFGRRPPFQIPSPLTRGGMRPWILNPLAVEAGLMLGAWLFTPAGFQFPSGWVKCWDLGGPKVFFSGPTTAFAGTCDTNAGDYNLNFQVPAGANGVDTPSVIAWPGEVAMWIGPSQAGGTRMGYTEKWRRPSGGPAQTIPWSPGVLPSDWPFQMPQWLTPGDPFMPEPYPIAPPISPNSPWSPAPDPTPRPNPSPAPMPTSPVAPGLVGVPLIPAISIPLTSLNGPPIILPDKHPIKAPTTPDKEKKGRIGYNAWHNAMKAALNLYTETDDLVSAIYKGLPWYIRRWRGRDGVWRDRDIRSDTRLARIYAELGELDVKTAMYEVAKNQYSDWAYGKIGQTLAQRAKALGKEGYWAGAGGFQRGDSLKRDQWQTMYEQLKKEGAKRVLKHARTYKVHLYDEVTNSWYWEERIRPFTQIPWFRQESDWKGLAGPGMAEYWELTDQEKRDQVRTVRRSYYARQPTARTIRFPFGQDRWYDKL